MFGKIRWYKIFIFFLAYIIQLIPGKNLLIGMSLWYYVHIAMIYDYVKYLNSYFRSHKVRKSCILLINILANILIVYMIICAINVWAFFIILLLFFFFWYFFCNLIFIQHTVIWYFSTARWSAFRKMHHCAYPKYAYIFYLIRYF